MQMTDLEDFRATLFASAGKQPHDAEEDMVSLRAALQPTEAQLVPINALDAHVCNWCGTWMPIPKHTVMYSPEATPNTEAMEITTAEILEPEPFHAVAVTTADITEQLSEAERGDASGNNENKFMGDTLPIKSNKQWDFDGLIEVPMLCEVVSKIRDSEKARERKLRSEGLLFPTQPYLKKYRFLRSSAQTLFRDPPAQSEPGGVPLDCPQQ